MLGHRQRKQRYGFGSQRGQDIGLFTGQNATLGGIENMRQIQRMLRCGSYPPLSTRSRPRAQCLTSAEHCMRLKCYESVNYELRLRTLDQRGGDGCL